MNVEREYQFLNSAHIVAAPAGINLLIHSRISYTIIGQYAIIIIVVSNRDVGWLVALSRPVRLSPGTVSEDFAYLLLLGIPDLVREFRQVIGQFKWTHSLRMRQLKETTYRVK